MNASQCEWCEWHKVRSIAMQHGQFFQGDNDEKISLPIAKPELENATPGRGKTRRSSVFLAFGVLVQTASLTEKRLVRI
jgi:hypothetical protein